jgi:hypothetical protein
MYSPDLSFVEQVLLEQQLPSCWDGSVMTNFNNEITAADNSFSIE